MERYKIGIIGGAGYTASELIRLLLNHEFVDIKYVVSSSQSGKFLYQIHRDLFGETELQFVGNINNEDLKSLQCVFLCLPHGESKKWVLDNINAEHIKNGLQIIDLGNDFRVENIFEIEGLEKKFIYAVPEFNKTEIANSQFIANPGCFATAIQLGLMPLAGHIVNNEIYVTGVTGSTGAGRAMVETTNFNWRNNNFSPYKTFTHQHLGEIKKNLKNKHAKEYDIAFTPFRGNFTRGIFITSVLKTELSLDEIYDCFAEFYSQSLFVQIAKDEIDLKQVINTNKCVIKIEEENILQQDNEPAAKNKAKNKVRKIAVHSIIDNLLKGASGQAIQNFNIMNHLPEATGLRLKSIAF